MTLSPKILNTQEDTFENLITDLVGNGITVKGDEFFVTKDACLQLFAWLVNRAESCKDGIHDLIIENVLDYGEAYCKNILVPHMLGQEPKYSMTDITCSYIRELLDESHSDLIMNHARKLNKSRFKTGEAA